MERKTNSVAIRVIAMCLSLSLTAFSGALPGQFALRGSYRLYSGPALPVSQVAILASETGPSDLILESIDGTDGPGKRHHKSGYSNLWNGSFNLELLPGPHVLTFRYCKKVEYGYYIGSARVSTFVAEPGRLYQATAGGKGGGWAKVTEVGLIPAGYRRPTMSCESFPKYGSGCIKARDGGPGTR